VNHPVSFHFLFVPEEPGKDETMRSMRIAGISITVMILAGCAHSGPRVSTGGYSFDLGDSTYRIVSLTPRDMVGYNTLVMNEDEETIVLGIDKDQNGSLDEVVQEGLSLEEGRRIYSAGIIEGMRRGLVKMRTVATDFTIVIDEKTYVLTTYVLAVGEVYNKLVVASANIGGTEAIVVDLGADGQLDMIEAGLSSLEEYQTVYRQVLDRAMKRGRVKIVYGTYRIVM
jgi:hypothetical protein